jgi:hypothetical protein
MAVVDGVAEGVGYKRSTAGVVGRKEQKERRQRPRVWEPPEEGQKVQKDDEVQKGRMGRDL